MGEDSVAEELSRRLPLYAYLERIWAGRSVLEIGRDVGAAEFLKSLGAARVVTTEAELPAGHFDVVVVPEADAFLARPGAAAAWRALLTAGGRLVVAAGNADRPGVAGGIGYYELRDAIAGQLPCTQMLGVTPFAGVGLVEFEGAADGLRIDSRLVKDPEPPSTYVAIGGSEPLPGLGYALVQTPAATRSSAGRPAGGEVGRQLEEASAQAESAMRVARAQGDEIEELRGRLRRAAEDRAGLDAENAKLRRALAEADEAVVNLTRRTADEMAALSERLAAGLRAPPVEAERGGPELGAARAEADRLQVRLTETEARAAAAEQRLEELGAISRERQTALEDAQERLRLAESELGRARRDAARWEAGARTAVADGETLAARERALAARDERIAKLEGEKQDLLWRLAELEDKLRQAIARAVVGGGARGEAGRAEGAPAGDLAAAREARERALEEFHRAASTHVDEVTELRATIAEQEALAAELEEAVASNEARAASATSEATALRQTAKDLEEADRARRSRLAELEGKLLRLEHERKADSASDESTGRDRHLRELERERDGLRARLTALESAAGGRAAAEPVSVAAEGNGHPVPAGRAAAAGELRDPDLLENRLGNTRERAARLRDDLEGIRRRLESLSASEISGYLEELGEDLAELGR